MNAASRLDRALVDRGLASSRQKAQALVRAGLVRLESHPAERVDQRVRDADSVEVLGRPRFVGRGGEKLRGALDALKVSAAGRVCIDVGASTGGFTDVLLQDGARHVYAVDVGHAQLDWRLRQDERVTVLERTNIRELREVPGESPDLAVADLSFISLDRAVPAIRPLLARPADLVLLFKPQFEVGRARLGKGGVVRDAEARREALDRFVAWATEAGLEYVASVDSALRGASGNQETFVQMRDTSP